ncbi:MAG: nucleoside-triphosphatase [Longimicrobiales bacterium]
MGLQPLWQRAAVLGSLWAASEIVLGSFLHNLRVPFSGHVLTAIAIVLLAAGHRTWPLKGLLVRAGLIAALMKSASPSAVLLGPMVAIAMEGALMEGGVRLLGGRVWGYALGGALAMSWTLCQKLVSLLVTYGADLVRVYQDLVTVAERQVGAVPLGPWGPILALASLNLVVGLTAGVVGSRLGSGRPPLAKSSGSGSLPVEWRRRLGGVPGSGPRPRLGFLLMWGIALPLGLFSFGSLALWGKVLLAAGAILVAAARYGRALRRLARPGFWAGLLVVTMLAGTVTGALSGEEGMGWGGGLLIGIGMSLHAVFVTMCFAALSTELSHPALRKKLEEVGGGQLHRGVHAAFTTLPLVVASLPSGREFLRQPLTSVRSLLPRMGLWLQALQEPPVVVGVVTGGRGRGKTATVSRIVEVLRQEGLGVGGILAPGELRDGRRWSVDLLELRSGRRMPMATRDPASPWPALGSFRVNPEALEMGRLALSPETLEGCDLVVVDEVGPWELAGEGWAEALEALRGRGVPLLLVVRRSLVKDVMARFAPGGAPVWEIPARRPEEITRAVLDRVRSGAMTT